MENAMNPPRCARCGSDTEWLECYLCGGEGVDGHDCGDDTCCCLNPEDDVECDVCEGDGGWMRCISEAEWCQANPLSGNESVGAV